MQQGTAPPAQRIRLPAAVTIPILVLAGVAVGVLATRPLGGEPEPSFFVIGSAQPGVQIGQIAPGTANAPAAPALKLVNLDGSAVALQEFGGKPLWIVFWKTDCEPCEAEAADVAAAYAAHRGTGLVLLGIDVWDTVAVVHDYAADHELAYPIAIDPSATFMAAYGVWGAPTHYFIGPDGVIRDRWFGPMSTDLIEKGLAAILVKPAS